MDRPSASSESSAPDRIQVRIEGDGVSGGPYTYGEPFTIGRSKQATLQLSTGRVSRIHAEVAYEDGQWWLRDADSTNGVYHDGARTDRVALDGEVVVRLGREGPILYFERLTDDPTETLATLETDETVWAPQPLLGTPGAPSERGEARASEAQEADSDPERGAVDPASVSQLINHYFEEDSGRPAGERTMMIREAFKHVQKKQQRAYGGVIGGIAALLLVALAFVGWQQWRVAKLEAATEALFYEVKAQEMETAQFRRIVEERGDAELSEQLAALEERRRQKAERYAGYVEELGLYRKLTPEEREIYRVARIFNESEFSMPAGFVREVKATIREWQSSPRFERAIRKAEQNGYIRHIVETMQQHGLPPEFFYLAMQESDFNTCAVGPETRWGIAKGMWQFIPPTGQAYGLVIGPRAEQRVCDPLDERHDFQASTDAAARYLLYIYTELAQASGLLAMASYNWGEHRVLRNLDRLPETPLDVVRVDVEGVPQNPQQRNYWHFLSEYRERMPEETKGYVLRIFAAAVIGHNPRLFGFDFDNPLKPYIEAAPAVASSQP